MRSRVVRWSFFADRKVRSLDYQTRLFFIGLWCIADDKGRFEEDFDIMKATVFPSDDVDVEQLLKILCKKGFVTRYKVRGEAYYHIKKFNKYQPINRPTESKLPEPPKQVTIDAAAQPHSLSHHDKSVSAHVPVTEPSLPKAKVKVKVETGENHIQDLEGRIYGSDDKRPEKYTRDDTKTFWAYWLELYKDTHDKDYPKGSYDDSTVRKLVGGAPIEQLCGYAWYFLQQETGENRETWEIARWEIEKKGYTIEAFGKIVSRYGTTIRGELWRKAQQDVAEFKGKNPRLFHTR